MKFSKPYFIWFVLLLLIEISIATFIKTGFIRHTLGDFLVVILLYCFLKSFLKIKPLPLAGIVLSIAFVIEFLQLTSFLKWLNLEDHAIAKVVLGSTFHVSDLIAYTLGVLIVLVIELKRKSI